MKVRCVDNWNCENLIKVGEVYDVSEWGIGYQIKPGIIINKNKFEIVEEDKMEEIRVVRKLEDLIGLKNGYGLEITKGHTENMVCVGDLWTIFTYDCKIDLLIKNLKQIGFKFEYKPLRSLEEVLEEIRNLDSLPFVYGGENWSIACSCKEYYAYLRKKSFEIGVKFMSESLAKKYADELNEIIGGK